MLTDHRLRQSSGGSVGRDGPPASKSKSESEGSNVGEVEVEVGVSVEVAGSGMELELEMEMELEFVETSRGVVMVECAREWGCL